MNVRERATRFLLIAATTAGATFTILVAGGSGSLEAQPVRIIYIGMAALALIPWLVGAIVRPSWRPSSHLMLPIGAILVAYAISTVTSRNQRISLEMFGYAVLLSLLYLLLVTLMRRPEIRQHFERLALLLCLLVSSLYAIQVFAAWIDWWGLVGHLTIPPLRPGYAGFTLGSPNPVATLVLLLGAFGLATMPPRLLGNERLVGLILGLVALATLLSGSRGAWLGFFGGLAATVAALFVLSADIRARLLRRARSRWGIATGGLAFTVVVAAVAFAGVSGRLNLEDGGSRAAFARASLQMLESSPVSGVGPGLWGILRAANTAATDIDLYIPHAHNVYLQTLAEFGLVGVFATLVVGWSLAVLLRRAVRSGDMARTAIAVAALFGLVMLAVQQVADVLVNVPAIVLAMALPIAWLDATDPSIGDRRATLHPLRPGIAQRVPIVAAALGTILILVGLLRVEAIASIARQGTALAEAGAWREAAVHFRLAADADPDVGAYLFQLGVSAANSGDLVTAERALSGSTASDAYSYAWLDLAAVRWRLGDVSGAREALSRADQLGLQRMPMAVASGWLHQQLGDHPDSIDAYVLALIHNPTLAGSSFWSSVEGPPGGLSGLLEVVEQRASPPTMLRLYLELRQYELARVVADALSESDPGLYVSIVPAWRGDPAAWSALQAAIGERALDPGPATWGLLVAQHLRDRAAANTYRGWLTSLSALDGSTDEVMIDHGSGQAMAHNLLDRYGSTYRRDVLSAQIVEILPQVITRPR